MTRDVTDKSRPGLAAGIKQRLIQDALQRKLKSAGRQPAAAAASGQEVPEQHYRFALHPGYQQLRIISEGAARLGVSSPFFKVHEGNAAAATRIAGDAYLNFASYNYLGLSGDLAVSHAAKIAIDETRNTAGHDVERCAAAVRDCFASADYAEGRTAFMEKRRPNFTGK